jgi:hypothetical protein
MGGVRTSKKGVLRGVSKRRAEFCVRARGAEQVLICRESQHFLERMTGAGAGHGCG